MKQKPYSNMRYFIEFISIMFLVYLIGTGMVAFIGNLNYRDLLTSEGQLPALGLFYWWIPLFRICDMEERDREILNLNKKYYE